MRKRYQLPTVIEVENCEVTEKDKYEETEKDKCEKGQPKGKEILVHARGTWSKQKTKEAKSPYPPLPFTMSDKDSSKSDTSNQSPSPLKPDDQDVPIVVRKGIKSHTQHPISNFVSYSHLSPSYRVFLSEISFAWIPNCVQDALVDPKWKSAMIEEMKALHKSGTWELMTLPKRKRNVGYKWV